MSKHSASDERDWGAFIPSFLDDYGLTPEEFRIYAHIARRAGSSSCWESIGAIANFCKMNVKTARKALTLLKEARLVEVEERPGKTTIYRLTKNSLWATPEQLDQLRSRSTPTKSGSTKLGRGTKLGTTNLGQGTPTKLGRAPLPKEAYEGTPIRYSQEDTPSLSENAFFEPENNAEKPGLEREEETASLPEPRPTHQNTSSLSIQQEDNNSNQEPAQDEYSAAPISSKKENYVHPAQKTEAYFRGNRHPWQSGQRSYDSGFVEYLAKQLPGDGQMNPKLKARNYITNCHNSESGTQKLYDAWEIYQEDRQRKEEQQRSIALSYEPVDDPPQNAPPDPSALEAMHKFRETVKAIKREVSNGSSKTA